MGPNGATLGNHEPILQFFADFCVILAQYLPILSQYCELFGNIASYLATLFLEAEGRLIGGVWGVVAPPALVSFMPLVLGP